MVYGQCLVRIQLNTVVKTSLQFDSVGHRARGKPLKRRTDNIREDMRSGIL